MSSSRHLESLRDFHEIFYEIVLQRALKGFHSVELVRDQFFSCLFCEMKNLGCIQEHVPTNIKSVKINSSRLSTRNFLID